MSSDKSETIKTFRLALVVLTVGLLCAGNAAGQDEKKAESNVFEATLAAAKDGDTDAMYTLGLMYANGEDVIEDDKEAVKWYRKAAELGHADAMFNLGVMYGRGRGVIKDYVQGYAWINVAAAKG